MAGYWRNPEATAASFAPGGWFRTGDLATVSSTGYISVVDRIKDMVRISALFAVHASIDLVCIAWVAVSCAVLYGKPTKMLNKVHESQHLSLYSCRAQFCATSWSCASTDHILHAILKLIYATFPAYTDPGGR